MPVGCRPLLFKQGDQRSFRLCHHSFLLQVSTSRFGKRVHQGWFLAPGWSARACLAKTSTSCVVPIEGRPAGVSSSFLFRRQSFYCWDLARRHRHPPWSRRLLLVQAQIEEQSARPPRLDSIISRETSRAARVARAAAAAARATHRAKTSATMPACPRVCLPPSVPLTR